jgi:YD repeat-containing protein
MLAKSVVCFFGIAASISMMSGSAVAVDAFPELSEESGLSANRDYLNQAGSEYIDPFTGALQLHNVDLYLPGNGGFDLKVVRSYSSNTARATFLGNTLGHSAVGMGWTVHFGRFMLLNTGLDVTGCTDASRFVSTIRNPILELPDGSRQMLAYTTAQWGAREMLSPQRWRAYCNGSNPVVYSPEGIRYEMNYVNSYDVKDSTSKAVVWHTTKIIDRNGNWAEVKYDNGLVTQVVASDGRNVVFNYRNECWKPSANLQMCVKLLSSITSSGRTYSYSYERANTNSPFYLLTAVTRPDWLRWEYEYDKSACASIENCAASILLLNKTTTPQGGTTRYGYEWVRFDYHKNMKSSVAIVNKSTNQGTWGFRYVPGSGTAYDTTTVTMPNNSTIVYRHFGVAAIGKGSIWKGGLLVSKTINPGDYEETYNWDKQSVSSQNYCRPSGCAGMDNIDESTFAPVMTKRTIKKDGAIHTTSYSNFDAYGNPQTITESGPNAASRTSSLSYHINSSLWIINQIKDESFDSGRFFIRRNFDSRGNLTFENINGVATSYSYDGQGNRATVTYPRSLQHTYSNYYRGIARTEIQPAGITLLRTVDDAGNTTSIKDGEGRTTSYQYDVMNRIIRISRPLGNPTTIAYEKYRKTSKRGNLVEVSEYNGFDMPIAVTLAGIKRSFTVDALGRRTFASHPASSVGTRYAYDALDRLVRVEHPGSSHISIFYGNGFKSVTDERGYVTTYRYRSYGDPDKQFLMSITAPVSAASVAITRNSGDLVTQIAQGGYARNYGYDSRYYLTSTSNPENGMTTYGRDDAGNMISRTVGGQTTRYTYDGQNRLIETLYPDGVKATQAYTRTNKLKTVEATPGVRRRSFEYDVNDNLLSESLAADTNTLITRYSYTMNDHLASVSYPVSGNVVDYAPDVLGRPTRVSGYVDTVSYWPSGQIREIGYRNGVVTTYEQDSNRLLPSSFVTLKQAGSIAHNRATYQYDGSGNLLKINEASDTGLSRELAYDGINRLTHVKGPWGAGRIDYDGIGNIIKQDYGAAAVLNYSYDNANRLSSVSGTRAGSYTYDAAGNMLSAPFSTYAWDGASNLIRINCSGSAANCVENLYDGLNQRIAVTKAGVTTYEVYDSNGKLLAEYVPSSLNKKLVEYIYLGGKRIAQNEINTVTPVQLLVQRSGEGSISGAGISCGTDCTEQYEPGARVMLTASPASAYVFTGWGGACTGTSLTCVLDVNVSKSVSATFAAQLDQNQDVMSVLLLGKSLSVGQQLFSPNKQYRLILQSDSNLVLYDSTNRALWSTSTHGTGVTHATMQTDGNFVLYAGSVAKFDTRTHGSSASQLIVQNDGNVVIYGSGNKAIWSWKSGRIY